MARTDIHSPKNFDPAAYRVVDYVDVKPPTPPPSLGAMGPEALEVWDRHRKAWQSRILRHFPGFTISEAAESDHRSIHVCSHCGHNPIRYVAVVEHLPTGARLAFGEICADTAELADRDELKKKKARRERELMQEKAEREARTAAFRAEHGALLVWLESEVENGRSNPHPFLVDMLAGIRKWGSLTERQLAATEKWYASHLKRQAQRAHEAATEELNDFPSEEDRAEVEGIVLKVKEYTETGGTWNRYGPETYYKMIVKLEGRFAGNRVFGSIPAAIRPDDPFSLQGKRVKFSALFSQSNDDEHFGFYKRPTKAEVA